MVCFIVPAVLLTGIFAVLYKEYGKLPQVQPFVYGIKPAIVAIIIAAVPLLTLTGTGLPAMSGFSLFFTFFGFWF